MRTSTRWFVAGLMLCAGASAVCHASDAPAPMRATASSEWGQGYGAAQAVNGVAGIESDYWQTVEGQDKGAWVQIDLGRGVHVEAVTLTWARYQARVHCPPASVVILTGPSPGTADLAVVRRIGPDELPLDGETYGAGSTSSYTVPGQPLARYIRIAFPDGGQTPARYPGYLCIGEVEVAAPELVPRRIAVEGRFGEAVVDTTWPAVAGLRLRRPDGRLEPYSILAPTGHREWARNAYTYVVDGDGVRYESRWLPPAAVTPGRVAGGKGVRLRGIRLAAADGDPVAIEDWVLMPEGESLVWRIVRRFTRDIAVHLEGSPGLFSSFDARRLENSVTSTVWYDPSRIAAGPEPSYELVPLPGRVSQNHRQVILDRDASAVYKLWTSWPSATDARLSVSGGYLYRRGSYGFLSEAGATVHTGDSLRRAGEVEEITLRIAPQDAASTGYQLAVSIPDKDTEAKLRSFYGSLLNGGAVNDQAGYDFGNETDGWYYAGSAWMYGMALSAGVPATGEISAHPFDVARAMRGHLAHILATVGADGRACYGYNQGGEWVDDNLNTIIGTRAYMVHTGDVAFVRDHLPTLERMIGYFLARRDARGLFVLGDTGCHWYYDAVSISGTVGYYNAFLFKAALDLAEMEGAVGRLDKANELRAIADSVRSAFNAVLWREDLPGGPRYIDWIDSQGAAVTYFCDLCQWPPVAFGIASEEQARRMVVTADARLAELRRTSGYTGAAGLSALWPVPEALNAAASWQTFGVYMNGGSLLCQTYWEIMARCRAGDAVGAYDRLRRFAREAQRSRWVGDNSFTMQCLPQGDGEPYLADMVVVPAALVHGILGIQPTWDSLRVTPCLPPGWSGAQADILYKGKRHRVTIGPAGVAVCPVT